MISSIVLLLALQAVWLTTSYEKSYFDLRREVNGLFRATILTLRDSTEARQFVEVKSDSVGIRPDIYLTRIRKASGQTRDTLKGTKDFEAIKVFISAENSHPDSAKRMLKPIVSRIRDVRFRSGENFILTMKDDSISLDSVQLHFKTALANANVNVPFELKYSSFVPTPSNFHKGKRLFRRSENRDPVAETKAFSNTLSSDWIPTDPVRRYGVILTDFRGIIIRNILPQILFSIFLSLLTIGAFVVLYKSLRSQQRLLVMKNDFIDNITHELKTPIATVSVAIEALKSFNGIDNPIKTREYLDIAQFELNRLTVLTDKVLSASLFDEKGVTLEIEKIDLERTLNEIVSSTALIADKTKTTIDIHKSGQDFTIEGSVVHLSNVVYNLIDNAIKYSPVKPKLSITLHELANQVSLSVADKGLGIPKEFHNRIFEKFFRMPTGDIHTVKGHGLGLSYVESVVKAHHGTISITSEVGKGSTFTIVLPKINSQYEQG